MYHRLSAKSYANNAWLPAIPLDASNTFMGYTPMTLRTHFHFHACPEPRRVCLLIALSLATLASLSAQDSPKNAATPAAPSESPQTIKQAFTTLEVAIFQNVQDSHFPAEYIAPLQAEIKKQLVSAKAFPEVILENDTATPAATSNSTSSVLRLTGTITNYNPGSRAKIREIRGHV